MTDKRVEILMEMISNGYFLGPFTVAEKVVGTTVEDWERARVAFYRYKGIA